MAVRLIYPTRRHTHGRGRGSGSAAHDTGADLGWDGTWLARLARAHLPAFMLLRARRGHGWFFREWPVTGDLGREHFMPRHRGFHAPRWLGTRPVDLEFLGLRVSLGDNGRCQRRSVMPPPDSSEQIFRTRDAHLPTSHPLPTSRPPAGSPQGPPPNPGPTRPNFPRRTKKGSRPFPSHILFLRQWRGRPRARLDGKPPLLFPKLVGPRFRVACKGREGEGPGRRAIGARCEAHFRLISAPRSLGGGGDGPFAFGGSPRRISVDLMCGA